MSARSSSLPFFIFLALCFIGSGAYFIWESNKNSEASGVVIGSLLSQTGSPESRLEGSPFWRGLNVGQPLVVGEKIKTGNNEFALVRFSNGEILRVLPNSMVTLQDPARTNPFKIDIGKSEITGANPQSEDEVAELISQTQNLVQTTTQIKMVQNDQIVEISHGGSDRLTPLLPSENSVVTVKVSESPQLELRWQGVSGNSFDIEVEWTELKSIQKYFTRNLSYNLVLDPNQSNTQFKWRVTDNSSGQQSEWIAFEVEFLAVPIIIRPKSHSVLTQNSEDKALKLPIEWRSDLPEFEVKVSSSFFEREYVSRTRSLTLDSSVFKNAPLGQHPITIQVRGKSSEANWSPWSEPLTFTYQNLAALPLKISQEPAEMLCQQQEWGCAKPILVTFNSEGLSGSSYQVRWQSGGFVTSQPLTVQSNQASVCPPHPATNWSLQVTENLANGTYRESDSFTLSALPKTPPQPKSGTRLIAPNELLARFDNCTHTLLNIEAVSNSEPNKRVSKITASGSEILTLPINDAWLIKAQYLSSEKTPLSAWGQSKKTPQFKIDLGNMSQLGLTPRGSWSLQDAGEIFAADSQSQPWTPLRWRSNPPWPEYEYQIAKDPEFTQIIESNRVKKQSLTLRFPENTDTVYWRVRGLKDELISGWSKANQIQVKRIQAPSRSVSGSKE